MKIFRKWVGLLAAVVLATFVLPAFAQDNKNFVLLDFPPQIPRGTNVGVKVTILNNSPQGNANFNSFRLVAPPGILISSAVRHADTVPLFNAQIAPNPIPAGGVQYIDVTNIAPSVGKNSRFSLTLTLEATCAQGGKWIIPSQSSPYTRVWSGANLSGQEFTNKTNPDAATLVEPCWEGTLSCGQVMDASFSRPEGLEFDPLSSEPGYANVQRWYFNAKGTTCTNDAVNFAFTNRLLDVTTGGKSVLHKWDTTVAEDGAFYYKLNGALKSTSDPAAFANGLPIPVTPQVAWIFNQDGSLANRHAAYSCLSPNMPRPFGKVGAGGLVVVSTDPPKYTFTLDTSEATPLVDGGDWEAPLATPFPIYISGERMTVFSISSSSATWTVQRGGTHQAGTDQLLNTGVGAYVMSTPLPVNSAGTVEQICIVTLGWKMYSPGQFFWFLDAIDIGDGWIGTEN